MSLLSTSSEQTDVMPSSNFKFIFMTITITGNIQAPWTRIMKKYNKQGEVNNENRSGFDYTSFDLQEGWGHID